MAEGFAVFTPNPNPDYGREYWDLVAIVTDEIVWRYFGCSHHCEEFISASRAAGDTVVYHAFWADFSNRKPFCEVCYYLRTGEPRALTLNPQRAAMTFRAMPT